MSCQTERLDIADGFSIYSTSGSAFEAKFIYKEIFQDKCYDVAELPKDAFVIDAGGNIGMFSIYMKQKYPAARILAFEPVPVTYSLFQRNMEHHGISGVTVHQCGLGRDDSQQTLTFYPDMPGNSTLYNEEKEEVLRIVDAEHPVAKGLQKHEQVKVPIKRLSGFLHQVPDLKRIDLLKIDVEGAELDVLHGLDAPHWELVDNIALEICDRLGSLAEAERLLQSKGFRVSKEKADWAPDNHPIYMVVAQRV